MRTSVKSILKCILAYLTDPYPVANGLKGSKIKERLKRLHAQPSGKWARVKVFYLFPLLLVAVLLFARYVSGGLGEVVEPLSLMDRLSKGDTLVYELREAHYDVDPTFSDAAFLVLYQENGQVKGHLHATTDELEDAREGYTPGYFVDTLQEVSLVNDMLYFKVSPCEFFAAPIPLCYACDKEAARDGYQAWGQWTDGWQKERSYRMVYHAGQDCMTEVSEDGTRLFQRANHATPYNGKLTRTLFEAVNEYYFGEQEEEARDALLMQRLSDIHSQYPNEPAVLDAMKTYGYIDPRQADAIISSAKGRTQEAMALLCYIQEDYVKAYEGFRKLWDEWPRNWRYAQGTLWAASHRGEMELNKAIQDYHRNIPMVTEAERQWFGYLRERLP